MFPSKILCGKMLFSIFLNQEALEKMIILYLVITFSVYENTMYIFIMRKDCLFRNFRMFLSLVKKYFPCFHLQKMLISLFLLLRKVTEIWHFRITEMSENLPKYRLFVYFHVFTPCERMRFFVQFECFPKITIT